jgi:hypothetical protein
LDESLACPELRRGAVTLARGPERGQSFLLDPFASHLLSSAGEEPPGETSAGPEIDSAATSSSARVRDGVSGGDYENVIRTR